MKVFKKKVSSYFMGETLCTSSTEKLCGVYALSIFAKKCGLKLVNILNLAKRTV